MNDSTVILREKVSSLEAALLARHPTMPTLLRDIHSALRAQPENVTLLSEDEIRVLVSGLQTQTNTFLATTVVKESKKSAGTKALLAKGADAF